MGRGYVKPRRYLQPAIEEHAGEYKTIAENELRGGAINASPCARFDLLATTAKHSRLQ